MNKKFYPDSGVEIQGFIAKFYDSIMNIGTLGAYQRFIRNAIKKMKIDKNDKIVDFGAGTGRNALLMRNYLTRKGEILGLEISDLMIAQFDKKFKDIDNVEIRKLRIDKQLSLEKRYDKVFISFVFHGFPFVFKK